MRRGRGPWGRGCWGLGESLAKLPAKGAPRPWRRHSGTPRQRQGDRPKREAAAGGRVEGSRMRRSRQSSQLCGGGGPTAAAVPGPHKEETTQLVGLQPQSPGPAQRGRGRPHWDSGGKATRKRHFLPGPPPRTKSQVFRSRWPGGLPSPQRAPSPAPAGPTHPWSAVKSAADRGFLLFSWDEAPRPPESRFSQAPVLAPPLPNWASASITQYSSAPLQSALLVGPEYP